MRKAPRTSSAATKDVVAPLEFCLRLTRASTVVTNRLDRRLSGLHGLSFGDFMVLYYLSRAPEMRLRRIDLAHRMELTASGVTRTVQPLEKRGLVSRQNDPRDARVAFACLTKTGQRLLADALLAAEQVCQEVAQAVPPDGMDAISSILGKLAGINLTNT
jgi:DNA-binding MarR family transcriptional regulator